MDDPLVGFIDDEPASQHLEHPVADADRFGLLRMVLARLEAKLDSTSTVDFQTSDGREVERIEEPGEAHPGLFAYRLPGSNIASEFFGLAIRRRLLPGGEGHAVSGDQSSDRPVLYEIHLIPLGFLRGDLTLLVQGVSRLCKVVGVGADGIVLGALLADQTADISVPFQKRGSRLSERAGGENKGPRRRDGDPNPTQDFRLRIRVAIASSTSLVDAVPPKSCGRCLPSFNTAVTAFRTRSPAARSPM